MNAWDSFGSDPKGHIMIRKKGDPQYFILLAVTGTGSGTQFITDCVGEPDVRRFECTVQATGNVGGPLHDDDVVVSFEFAGDKGSQGVQGDAGETGATGATFGQQTIGCSIYRKGGISGTDVDTNIAARPVPFRCKIVKYSVVRTGSQEVDWAITAQDPLDNIIGTPAEGYQITGSIKLTENGNDVLESTDVSKFLSGTASSPLATGTYIFFHLTGGDFDGSGDATDMSTLSLTVEKVE